MKLFGQLIRTAVNVATLPVAIAKDAITLGRRSDDQTVSRTREHLERLKSEASEDA